MENKSIIKLMILIIILSLSPLYAQDNFTTHRNVPVESGPYTFAHYYLSFAEVDNTYLALVVSSNFQDGDQMLMVYKKKGYWYSNPTENPGYYNSSSSFFLETFVNQDVNVMNGIVAVDLGAGKLDPVLVRSNQLQVHRNANNTISGIVQSSSSGIGSYITKGRFENSDDYDDVGIKYGNYIRIFKNLRNGYLDLNTPFDFNINLQKFLITQIDDYIDLFRVYNSNSNKEDVVGYYGNNIYIYNNDNNNGLASTPTTIDAGMLIDDIDVADFNNDGYNDIVAVGYSYATYTYYAKVYLNSSGTIQSTPSFSVSTELSNMKIKAKDLNMDGLSDFVILGLCAAGKVYFNTNSGSNFTLQQSLPSHIAMTGLIDQMELADIYNKGGLALVYGAGGSSGGTSTHGIYIRDAVLQDANPAPPRIFKDYVLTGYLWRPKIIIKNREDRDISQYQIWKKGVGSNDFVNFATINSNQDEWTDMSEYIVWSEGDETPPDNCFYYVKCIDQTSNASVVSNELGYHVQGPTPIPPPEDNPTTSSNINFMPKDYSICNFPNPFNPVTKIMYSLPKDGFVKITIYDILGREIVKVTNEFKKKGNYIYDFNASRYSSGIYFYTFEVNGYKVTKSMLLVK